MKIVISPSKTQNPQKSTLLIDKQVIYKNTHMLIQTKLKEFKKSEIGKIMKINKKLLDETYNNIQNYDNLPNSNAFESFNGLVFKGLQKDIYMKEEYEYIEDNLVILDALYGILEPGTLIKPYRLDLKMKIGLNLYSLWNISDYFKEELIINLASKEFSKLIDKSNYVNISFFQHKENTYVNQATYSKQERGKFLNHLILNKIDNINQMKKYNNNGYTYNDYLSDERNIIFTRSI